MNLLLVIANKPYKADQSAHNLLDHYKDSQDDDETVTNVTWKPYSNTDEAQNTFD
jgi:hypothetical protein